MIRVMLVVVVMMMMVVAVVVVVVVAVMMMMMMIIGTLRYWTWQPCGRRSRPRRHGSRPPPPF